MVQLSNLRSEQATAHLFGCRMLLPTKQQTRSGVIVWFKLPVGNACLTSLWEQTPQFDHACPHPSLMLSPMEATRTQRKQLNKNGVHSSSKSVVLQTDMMTMMTSSLRRHITRQSSGNSMEGNNMPSTHRNKKAAMHVEKIEWMEISTTVVSLHHLPTKKLKNR